MQQGEYMKTVINSLQKAEDYCKTIIKSFEEYKWLQATLIAGSRTLKQNNWIYQAYKMLASQGDQTELEYRAYCKMKLGLPILEETYPERVEMLRDLIKIVGYEKFLKFMIDEPVTSLFTLKQGARYIDEMTNHYNGYELPRKDWREQWGTKLSKR